MNVRIAPFQDLKDLQVSVQSWADEYTDLVQGGFQELFTKVIDHFHVLCVRSAETPSPSLKAQSAETVPPSLILLLSLLSVYLYRTAVPQITEVSTSFCNITHTSLFSILYASECDGSVDFYFSSLAGLYTK